MNDIQHLCAYLKRHQPTRQRPQHEMVDGWVVRLAQDDTDLLWRFSILADRWNGPYLTFDDAIEAARLTISEQR
jgi:hypothetical protein